MNNIDSLPPKEPPHSESGYKQNPTPIPKKKEDVLKLIETLGELIRTRSKDSEFYLRQLNKIYSLEINPPAIIEKGFFNSLFERTKARHEILHKIKHVYTSTLRAHPSLFQFACDSIKLDPQIVETVLDLDGLQLEFTSKEFKKNKILIMHAIKQNYKSFLFASQELQNDVELLNYLLQFASPQEALELLPSNQILIEIITQKISFEDLAEYLPTYPLLLNKALQNNPLILLNLKEPISLNEEQMNIVFSNLLPQVIIYHLHHFPELMVKILQEDPSSFHHLPASLQNNKMLINEMIKTHGIEMVVKAIPNNFYIASLAIEANPYLFDFLTSLLSFDPNLCDLLLQHLPPQEAIQRYPTNKRVVLRALDRDPFLYSSIQNFLKEDRDIIDFLVEKLTPITALDLFRGYPNVSFYVLKKMYEVQNPSKDQSVQKSCMYQSFIEKVGISEAIRLMPNDLELMIEIVIKDPSSFMQLPAYFHNHPIILKKLVMILGPIATAQKYNHNRTLLRYCLDADPQVFYLLNPDLQKLPFYFNTYLKQISLQEALDKNPHNDLLLNQLILNMGIEPLFRLAPGNHYLFTTVLKKAPTLLGLVDTPFLKDSSMIIKVIQTIGIKKSIEIFARNKSILFELIKIDLSCYPSIRPIFHNDPQLLDTIFSHYTPQQIVPYVGNDQSTVLRALDIDPKCFAFLSPQMQNDPDIIKKLAEKLSAEELIQLYPNMKNIHYYLITKDPFLFPKLSPLFQKETIFITHYIKAVGPLSAIRTCPNNPILIHQALLKYTQLDIIHERGELVPQETIFIHLIEKMGTNEPLKLLPNNKELAVQALRINYQHFDRLSPGLQQEIALIEMFVTKCGAKNAVKAYPHRKEIVLAAIKLDPEAIQYASPILQNDPNLQTIIRNWSRPRAQTEPPSSTFTVQTTRQRHNSPPV